MNYRLLTPGPLTTSDTVKQEMLEDRCTWDDEYKTVTQSIRSELLALADVQEPEYTTVLMQGSGSYVVESVLTSAVKMTDHLLVITNGAYGNRIVHMAAILGLHHTVIALPFNEVPTAQKIESALQTDGTITHIAIVHCETTTGMLNPIEEIGEVVDQYNKTFIVDAMSSFGGVPISIEKAQIDFLISSANKCIHGVPGFGFVIAQKDALLRCEGVAKSVSLDLYDQWNTMQLDGKWRFTSPTHVVAAFAQALQELKEIGGVQARYKHYLTLNTTLRNGMERLGFQPYIDEQHQSPIITTFLFPNEDFEFTSFYEEVKKEGFILYPGKLTEFDTFRIGNIGEVTEAEIHELIAIISHYMEELQWKLAE